MVEPTLEKVESLLKDRFKDYLVVATDGSDAHCLNSSMTSAIGLARYATLLAEKGLFEEGKDV